MGESGTEIPREGGVREGVAAEALGGEGVVEVGVAGEGDGDVGGVAVPVFGVAVRREGHGGAVGGDVVRFAIEGAAEEVHDLGGGVGLGWGGVHGAVQTGRGGDFETGRGQAVRPKWRRVM